MYQFVNIFYFLSRDPVPTCCMSSNVQAIGTGGHIDCDGCGDGQSRAFPGISEVGSFSAFSRDFRGSFSAFPAFTILFNIVIC
jgi:hypothetical protein